jgi:hypothetical protein
LSIGACSSGPVEKATSSAQALTSVTDFGNVSGSLAENDHLFGQSSTAWVHGDTWATAYRDSSDNDSLAYGIYVGGAWQSWRYDTEGHAFPAIQTINPWGSSRWKGQPTVLAARCPSIYGPDLTVLVGEVAGNTSPDTTSTDVGALLSADGGQTWIDSVQVTVGAAFAAGGPATGGSILNPVAAIDTSDPSYPNRGVYVVWQELLADKVWSRAFIVDCSTQHFDMGSATGQEVAKAKLLPLGDLARTGQFSIAVKPSDGQGLGAVVYLAYPDVASDLPPQTCADPGGFGLFGHTQPVNWTVAAEGGDDMRAGNDGWTVQHVDTDPKWPYCINPNVANSNQPTVAYDPWSDVVMVGYSKSATFDDMTTPAGVRARVFEASGDLSTVYLRYLALCLTGQIVAVGEIPPSDGFCNQYGVTVGVTPSGYPGPFPERRGMVVWRDTRDSVPMDLSDQARIEGASWQPESPGTDNVPPTMSQISPTSWTETNDWGTRMGLNESAIAPSLGTKEFVVTWGRPGAVTGNPLAAAEFYP